MQENMEELVTRLKHCRSLAEIQEACAAAGEKKSTVHLLTRVLGTEEMSVRWKAAVALTEIGSPAVHDLIRCLSDPRSFVRSSAAWVLGNIGDECAVPFLRGNLEDSSTDVRKETAEALGKLEKKRGNLTGSNGTRAMSRPTS
jgi:HEAT repeat protein